MRRILVVDDREEVRLALAMLLEEHDCEAILATDGSQVLPLVLETKPDLVLLDLAMPIMDGFEALRELRSNATTKETPVIIVTARTEVAEQARATALGIDDYITKPFSVADVMARINRVLNRNRNGHATGA